MILKSILTPIVNRIYGASEEEEDILNIFFLHLYTTHTRGHPKETLELPISSGGGKIVSAFYGGSGGPPPRNFEI